jgi:5-carboxymethyl-2-hydroxymuconate isomerase
MPHLVLLHTKNMETGADLDGLCRRLCGVMVGARDAEGKAVFPAGGTRVLAFPAGHSAVADGQHDYMFRYLNLRMAKGRSPELVRQIGQALSEASRAHLSALFDARYFGMTLHIDEGAEMFAQSHSSIHPLFASA